MIRKNVLNIFGIKHYVLNNIVRVMVLQTNKKDDKVILRTKWTQRKFIKLNTTEK